MPFIQFRVHPSVGMARMGDSHHAFFLGPEFPQFLQELYPNLRHKPRPLAHPKPHKAGSDIGKAHEDKYRDDDGQILPQGTRFRVFAYVYDTAGDLTPSRVIEVGRDEADIEWTVELANLKSVDVGGTTAVKNTPPKKTLATKASTAAHRLKDGSKINLGVVALEKDPADAAKLTHRLLLIGNEGEIRGSSSIFSGGLFKNDWHDSAADGPVTAKVFPKPALKGRFPGAKYYSHGDKDPLDEAAASVVSAVPAWAVVGLPDYLPDTGHLISLWDIALTQGLKLVTEGTAKAVDGQHKPFVRSAEMKSYQHTDYFAHIHPQLTLFKDLEAMSNQVRSASTDQNSADVEGSIPTGPGTAATTVTIGQAEADRIAIAANWSPARPPASNLDPFVMILTADQSDPTGTGVKHEYVRCTALGPAGVLTVSRGHPPSSAGVPNPGAQDWSGGPVDFIARAPLRVHEAELAAPVAAAATTIKLSMADARMLVAATGGATSMMQIVEGANTEWVECSANDSPQRAPGDKTADLTVVRGRNGTAARAFTTSAMLFAQAVGHKTLDVRGNRAVPSTRRKEIFGRLRKPSTLYDRARFESDEKRRPGDPARWFTPYPRPFGRRVDSSPDIIDPKHFPSTNVDVDPRGSLTRFLTVLKRPASGACKAIDPVLRSGASLTPPDTNAIAKALDDLYWPVTQEDMPMLKDYAFTRQQYQHFELWSRNPSNVWNGTFVFDDPDSSVLAAFFNAAHTSDEYFEHLKSRKPRFAPVILDIANLGTMIGGSFMPGIEVGREGGKPENWSLYHGANDGYPDVRFWPQGKTTPHMTGRLTIDLAVPWQGDFLACNETFWPTSRPQIVRSPAGSTYPWLESARHLSTEADFRAYWTRLGFVRRNVNLFEEREALFSRP
jgi:hypothetical protein